MLPNCLEKDLKRMPEGIFFQKSEKAWGGGRYPVYYREEESAGSYWKLLDIPHHQPPSFFFFNSTWMKTLKTRRTLMILPTSSPKEPRKTSSRTQVALSHLGLAEVGPSWRKRTFQQCAFRLVDSGGRPQSYWLQEPRRRELRAACDRPAA